MDRNEIPDEEEALEEEHRYTPWEYNLLKFTISQLNLIVPDFTIFVYSVLTILSFWSYSLFFSFSVCKSWLSIF